MWALRITPQRMTMTAENCVVGEEADLKSVHKTNDVMV
jgi:hypothetical protein